MDNLKALFTDCNREKEPLLNILLYKYGLNFEGKKCVENKSIRIYEASKSWWVADYGGGSILPNSYKGKGTNFAGLVYSLTSDFEGLERVLKQKEYITKYGCNTLLTTEILPQKAQNE
mgnify:FL=1